MSKENNILKYFNVICKNEKINIIPVYFTKISGGIAKVEYNGNKPLNVQFDVNRILDIENAILHEITHIILIFKKGYGGHNKEFLKLQNSLIDKYFYSDYSKILVWNVTK